jgi:hypothetical protein
MSEETANAVEKAILPLTHDQMIESLMIRGLDLIMTKPAEVVTRKKIFSEHPSLVLHRLEFLTPEVQRGIVEGIFTETPHTFVNDEGWWNYVCRGIQHLESQDPVTFFPNSSLYVLLNRIKDLKEEVSWYNVLLKLSSATVTNSSKCQGFSTVLNWLIQADPENLKNLLYRTEAKSYPGKMKVELFRQAIDLGLLDNKLARRIRSDSSGGLSSELLAYLFEHRSLYSDDVFQDLVTQFSDTKHKWVARYIAMNMPMHLIPFLMGIKDPMALNIIEKRMEIAEDGA